MEASLEGWSQELKAPCRLLVIGRWWSLKRRSCKMVLLAAADASLPPFATLLPWLSMKSASSWPSSAITSITAHSCSWPLLR